MASQYANNSAVWFPLMVASVQLSTQEFIRVFIEHCLVDRVHEIISFALVLRTGGGIFINHHATDWTSHHVVSPPSKENINDC